MDPNTSILVVEDDPVIAAVLDDVLTEEGYAVRTATDGQAALTALVTWPARVIVLDLMMPGMDGLGFLAVRRTLPRLAALPVILVSARPDALPSRERQEVASIVPKPFELTAVTNAVAACIAAQRTSHRPPAPSGALSEAVTV